MFHSVHFDPTIILFRAQYFKVSRKIIMRRLTFSAAYFKIVTFTIKFKPTGEFNFEKITDEYDIVIF